MSLWKDHGISGVSLAKVRDHVIYRQRLSCLSPEIIYAVFCPKLCSIRCETKRSVCGLMSGHKSNVTDYIIWKILEVYPSPMYFSEYIKCIINLHLWLNFTYWNKILTWKSSFWQNLMIKGVYFFCDHMATLQFTRSLLLRKFVFFFPVDE